MKLVVKSLLGVGITIVVLLAAVATYFGLFFDPNDIRTDIAQAVEKNTGRSFAIEGDLEVTYFPWLGFKVGKTRLGEDPQFGTQDFLTLDGASASIKLMPLLSKKIEIDKLTVKGLRVQLIRDENGTDNWASLAGNGDGAAAEPAATDSAESGSSFSAEKIGGIDIDSASVLVEDRQAGTTLDLSNINVSTGSIAPGDPVSLDVSLSVSSSAPALVADVTLSGEARLDGDDIRIDSPSLTIAGKDYVVDDSMTLTSFEFGVSAPALSVSESRLELPDPEITVAFAGTGPIERFDGTMNSGQVEVSLADQAVSVPAPELAVSFAGEAVPSPVELAFKAAALNVAPGGDALTISDYSVSTMGVDAGGSLNVSNLSTAPRLSGPLRVSQFSLRELLARLEIPLETADDSVLTKFSLAGDLRGSGNAVGIEGMTVMLDDTTIKGKASISDLAKSALAFDLTVNAIDVDRYLAPTAAPAEGEAGSAADAITVPSDTLRELNIAGNLEVGTLKIAGLESQNVRVGLNAAGGNLRVHPSEANLYGGKYTGDIRVDVTGEEPKISMNETVTGIDFAAFAGTVMPNNPLTGRLNGNVLLSARGSNTAEMQKTLNGSTRFDFADGVIQGIDLWHSVRSVIALADKSTVEAPPGPRQTKFQQLKGSADVTDGVLLTDEVIVSVQHLDVDGSGRVDLNDRSVDFRVQAKVVEEEGEELLPREQKLVGFRVPVFIGGTIEAPVVQKEKSVGAVVAQLAKRKLADKLGLLRKDDGEGGEDAASQDDVDKSVDEEKEEIKDKIDKKAKDLLKDLIG